MTVIIVTGTPGTGKTTYAKKFAKDKNYEYIDVKEVIKENNLSENHDDELDTDIIDTDKLNGVLIDIIKKEKDVVIDSHLSHYLPPELVDECIVTKCNIKTLKKRLVERGYSESKVHENLDAEIFDVCRIEALESGHNVIVIDTTQ
jgi:adenylate kinase